MRVSRYLLALVTLLTLAPIAAQAQTYTLAPIAKQQFLDSNADPVPGGKLCTYLSGTTTVASTYSDTAGTLNTNPIILSAAGRPTNGGVEVGIYLAAGSSYKFVLLTAGTDSTCATGTTVWSQDGIGAVPASGSSVDISSAVAGEALTINQCVYLSDGSGSKTSGRWYRCDAANSYSSTLPEVGLALATVTTGQTLSVRTAGSITGLSGLSVGAEYYVSASVGALTSTAPANVRHLGHADTTTSLVLTGNPSVRPVNLSECNGRITLTTGVPVTTVDVTAATSVKWTPYRGNRCALHDGANWATRTFAELSIAVPSTTSSLYDIFLYDNAGTLALELSAAWSSDTAIFGSGTYQTTRPTQDGVYVKSTNGTTIDTTRRYLGTFRTTTVSGQTEDSASKRLVWNYYNRVRRVLRVSDATASWTYTTAGFRQANGSTANQIAVVMGIVEGPIDLRLLSSCTNTTASPGVAVSVAFGLDGIAAFPSGATVPVNQALASFNTLLVSHLSHTPTAGYHFYVWMEYSVATGTTTWYGTSASLPFQTSGITGSFEG